LFSRHIRNGNIFLILAGLLFVLGIWVWQDLTAAARRFETEGVKVDARIVELERFVRREYSNGVYRDTTPTYEATVSYSSGSALDGTLQIHRESDPISGGFYERLREGQTIIIRHMPEDPTNIEIEPGWTENNAYYAIYTCTGMAVLVALVGLMLRNMVRGEARLAQNGIQTTGTLKRIIAVQKLAMLEFTFTDLTGKTYTARSKPHRQWVNSGLTPGADVDIIYDPKAPQKARHVSDIQQ